MSSSHTTIRVKFSRPIPIFPLHVAVLMPHAIAPLEIFEPRYRQMISDVLDGAGLIAMAVFEGDAWKDSYHGRPPIRPAVCVGHIAQHFKYEDGRYAIILQGVCRGRISRELPPSETKLYREAMIEPVGVDAAEELALDPYRDELSSALETAPLSDLRIAGDTLRHIRNPEIPTSVIIEFLGANLPENESDSEARYRWLAAGDVHERVQMVTKRMGDLSQLLRRAAPQRKLETPKGCNWN